MKRFAIKFLEYWPFIAIFVMIATCVVGIMKKAPEKWNLLFACVPIGLWTLWGIIKTAKYNKSKGN